MANRPGPPVDRKPSTLGDVFPWDTLRGTVVDVGGGSGHVSIALARRFPHLSFRVQDSEKMLAQGRRVLAKEDPAVASRIELQQHDFFQPQQPGGNAVAFFLRHVFHNWADADSTAILRALVPGLEASPAGTPMLISDRVLPCLGDGTPLHEGARDAPAGHHDAGGTGRQGAHPRRVGGPVPGGRREARAEEGVRAGAVGAVGSCAEEMSYCVRA